MDAREQAKPAEVSGEIGTLVLCSARTARGAANPMRKTSEIYAWLLVAVGCDAWLLGRTSNPIWGALLILSLIFALVAARIDSDSRI
jgi:hypothetical protein